MNPIPQVNGVPYVNNAEFVKLDLVNASNGVATTYTFSTSYKSENINGNVYTPLGGLLGVSTQQRDLSASSYDTAITLAGVDQTNIFYVLSSQYMIKGSRVQFYRGFYDSQYELMSAELRYTGIVTSWSIQENLEMDTLDDSYTVTINCSNYKQVLENLVSGRFTSPSSWKNTLSTDTSMDNVPNLINAYYNFGREVGK